MPNFNSFSVENDDECYDQGDGSRFEKSDSRGIFA